MLDCSSTPEFVAPFCGGRNEKVWYSKIAMCMVGESTKCNTITLSNSFQEKDTNFFLKS